MYPGKQTCVPLLFPAMTEENIFSKLLQCQNCNTLFLAKFHDIAHDVLEHESGGQCKQDIF
uniref:Uncharacterized protein n=1 Tax=Anguilla anguilla TaxID=7936 RepID=A0A0E9S111_ANGAN